MERQRKIVVFIATSANGLTSAPGGDISWLEREPSRALYGLMTFLSTIDTVICDHESSGKEIQIVSMRENCDLKTYIVSRKLPESLPPDVEWIKDPVKEFAQRLRHQPGKDIWLMGGSDLISTFLEQGEIDEFNVVVVPVFIGEHVGIPPFRTRREPTHLKLISSKKFKDGLMHLKYSVKH